MLYNLAYFDEPPALRRLPILPFAEPSKPQVRTSRHERSPLPLPNQNYFALGLEFYVVIGGAGYSQELPPALDREVDFARDVEPILQARCWSCHGSEKQESGLRLDRNETAFIGGDSGKAIVRNESANSLLIQYVSGIDPDHSCRPRGSDSPLNKSDCFAHGSIEVQIGQRPLRLEKTSIGPINR